MASNRTGSILTVDFGNVTTRALLMDVVEGAYQVIAQAETRTTSGFPSGDVTAGLSRVILDIADLTGRRLIDDDGNLVMPEQADRAGVDVFLTTASIGRPLRTVLMGLVPDVSIASGLRAVAGTYVQVVETVTLDDPRSDEDLINAMVLSRPDLIFIVGGTEEGAQEPVMNLARLALLGMMLMISQRKPAVLYAGNSELADEMQHMFGALTTLFIAPNVRPSLEEEELEAAQLQLALAFNALSTQRGAGFETVSEMSRFGVLPTAQGYNLVVDYLGQALGNGVVAVDVGSAVSTLSASFNGQVGTTIRTDLGLGHSARALMETVGFGGIREWLPFNISANDLNNYAWNKTLRPGGLPESIREFYLEYAFLRAGMRELVAATGPMFESSLVNVREGSLPAFGTAIGSGATLTQSGRPELTAMLLLDGLQPTGATELFADPNALLASLGAVARVNPAAVVQVLESSALPRLGASFSVSGLPRADRPAMTVRITTSDGQTIAHEVMGGHLWVYRVPENRYVTVDARAVGRGLSINGKNRLRLEVEGGAVGLIFDARGRPLPLADDVRERSNQLTTWVTDVTGDVVHLMKEEWLEPVTEDEVVVEAEESPRRRGRAAAPKAEKPQRRGRRGQQKDETGETDPFSEAIEPDESESDEMDELRDLLS
jgi:hypothetical protein